MPDDAAVVEAEVQAWLKVWCRGSVVRSRLLDLLVNGLVTDRGFASVRGYAEDSGTGRWTMEEAVYPAVPTPAIAAALFSSRQGELPAMKAIATLRNQVGGHAVRR